ncbi:Nif3-like dinuclear metal center hexameric protein [Bacteriovoracaceae bacterium]|nr:Nif3-like dinuclear metal center hexameric protein [Bacteriovoracaceae bacterium]
MKKITLENLENIFNDLLHANSFKDYGPNGVQVASSPFCSSILFAVSSDQTTIDYAIKHNFDTIVVHHGLFWTYQGAKPIKGFHGERIKKLIRNNINLIAYHLPLDGHDKVGNAATLAKKLNLTNIEPFGEYKGSLVGVKGEFEKPIKPLQFKGQLEKSVRPIIFHASPSTDKIKNIGIVTGGANEYWKQAKEEGLDAFLTGEISEYNYFEAIENNIHYFACGHHATEKYGVQALKSHLIKNYSKSFKFHQLKFFDSKNPV